MVVTLIESLKVTSLEGHAITVLERVALREKLKHEAALVIILTAKAALGYKYFLYILIYIEMVH